VIFLSYIQEAQRKAKEERLAAQGKGTVKQTTATSGGGAKRSQASKGGGEGGAKLEGKPLEVPRPTRQRNSSSSTSVTTDDHRPNKSSKSSKKAAEQQVETGSRVKLFSHLQQYSKAPSSSTLPWHSVSTYTSIHPAIIKLGLHYSHGVICGSNSRCVAMLAAFKKVINDYTTPAQKELRRDLDAHIRPFINFLTHCRPLSVSMGNAIKYLKREISKIGPDQSESEAKRLLCATIDEYLELYIVKAGTEISKLCQNIIKDNDVILVYAFSSVVQRVLLDAHCSGRQFRVIVVDSRPKMEGKHMLRTLVQKGVKCSYVLINAVSYIMKEVSKVIVGAHSLLANGYVMSRIGTSQVALVARSFNVPVLVCCETYKFSDRVQTDSIVNNELGDPNDLVQINRRQGNFLTGWKDIPCLGLLNLVYDVTSPDLVSMVITELGVIPCTSVPVVLRISRDETAAV
jgi:translation initiation factor eIF-2B subunit delta